MSDTPFDDDEEKRQRIEARNKRQRDRQTADLRKVLAIVEGRRFVWRLLSESGVFRTSFNQNALNMAFNEGFRNSGLLILDEILKNVPATFTQMQREHVSDLKSNQDEE